MNQTDPFVSFMSPYPVNVQAIALPLRHLIQSIMPAAHEMPDSASRIIAYGFGPGYKDIICTLIPSKTGIKLGIARGANLPDPDALLRGSGKLHRYILLAKLADLEQAGIKRMLAAALKAWQARVA